MSNNVSYIRSELSKLAVQIEHMLRQVQVFAWGLSDSPSYSEMEVKQVETTTVSNPNGTTTRNYHNVRDALGRFTKV
jgi:hypothetical protein